MSEEKAPFNSALDLLERLSSILTHITKVKQNTFLDSHDKQGYVLALTKDYYIQAIPLLSPGARTTLKKVLELKQAEAFIVENGRTTKRKKKIYTDAVETQINDILIEIQTDLQDVGKYFMPPRKKLGSVVGDFN